jgi:hypothetical protein
MVSPGVAEKLGLDADPSVGQLAGVGGVGGSHGRSRQKVIVRLGGVTANRKHPTHWQGCWSATVQPVVMTQDLVDTINVDVVVGLPVLNSMAAVIDVYNGALHYSPAFMPEGCVGFKCQVPLRDVSHTPMTSVLPPQHVPETWPRMTAHLRGKGAGANNSGGLATALPIKPGFPQAGPVATPEEYETARLKSQQRRQEDRQEGLRAVHDSASRLGLLASGVSRLTEDDVERVSARVADLVVAKLGPMMVNGPVHSPKVLMGKKSSAPPTVMMAVWTTTATSPSEGPDVVPPAVLRRAGAQRVEGGAPPLMRVSKPRTSAWGGMLHVMLVVLALLAGMVPAGPGCNLPDTSPWAHALSTVWNGGVILALYLAWVARAFMARTHMHNTRGTWVVAVLGGVAMAWSVRPLLGIGPTIGHWWRCSAGCQGHARIIIAWAVMLLVAVMGMVVWQRLGAGLATRARLK